MFSFENRCHAAPHIMYLPRRLLPAMTMPCHIFTRKLLPCRTTLYLPAAPLLSVMTLPCHVFTRKPLPCCTKTQFPCRAVFPARAVFPQEPFFPARAVFPAFPFSRKCRFPCSADFSAVPISPLPATCLPMPLRIALTYADDQTIRWQDAFKAATPSRCRLRSYPPCLGCRHRGGANAPAPHTNGNKSPRQIAVSELLPGQQRNRSLLSPAQPRGGEYACLPQPPQSSLRQVQWNKL